MAAGQSQVLRDLGGGWLQCQDQQGMYYFNQITQQSSETPPGSSASQPAQVQLSAQTQQNAGAGQTQVLRDLGGGWLQCQDQQGIYYFNQQTQQSSDVPPGAPAQPQVAQVQVSAQPQQQADTQVLSDLGGGWLQCKDAQGIFYFNQQTQQSSDTPPPHLAMQPQPTAQPAAPLAASSTAGQSQVLRELGGGWLQCKDDQGIYFFNQQTQQSTDVLPPELAGGAGTPALQQQQLQQQQLQAQQREAQQRLQAQQVQAQQMQAQIQAKQMQAQQAQQAPEQTRQKFTLGPWVVCEDGKGEFYYHTPTGQSFDQPPQELIQLYKVQQQQQQQQQPAPPAQQVVQYVQQPMQAQQAYAPQQAFATVGSYQPQVQVGQPGVYTQYNGQIKMAA